MIHVYVYFERAFIIIIYHYLHYFPPLHVSHMHNMDLEGVVSLTSPVCWMKVCSAVAPTNLLSASVCVHAAAC